MLTKNKASRLVTENQQFAGTGGVSEGNTKACFIPAFQDSCTGQVEVSRFQDGRPAPFHLLDGLPDAWITQRDLQGRVIEIKTSITSGFIRLGKFFTRQQASDFMAQHSAEGI